MAKVAKKLRNWKHQFYKNPKVKQLGPQLALGWVTIHGLNVATNTVKSQKRIDGGASYMLLRPKKRRKTSVILWELMFQTWYKRSYNFATVTCLLLWRFKHTLDKYSNLTKDSAYIWIHHCWIKKTAEISSMGYSQEPIFFKTKYRPTLYCTVNTSKYSILNCSV